MHHRRILALFLIVCLCLCACQSVQMRPTEPSKPTEPSSPSNPSDSNNETDGNEEQPPQHSAYYLEGYTVEQVIAYFAEVVLDMEYSSGSGNPSLVQKWTKPLEYVIFGAATEQDFAVLYGLFEQLNTIEGFPGIVAYTPGELANFSLGFYNKKNFNQNFSSVINNEEADGAVEFWYYTATNQIYDARIGYRTDISQDIRNSVLLEEVVNALGISDTLLRQDSITYQYGSDAQTLSDMDWLILKLLYHPDIACGMNYGQCKAIIEQLYY